MSDSTSFSVRKSANEQALVFVHGFSGDAHLTFGLLPAFIAGDAALAAWDIHCFGYPTSLAPDITGIWSADPDLTTLADFLRGHIDDGRFGSYQRLALIAHSMGGLIVQRALVDAKPDDRVSQVVSHVLLFGTPSNGLRKAGLGAFLKRQAKDMAADGAFVTFVRAEWNKRFQQSRPFFFRAVAGLRDDFVPRTSSVDVFPDEQRAFVDGNHLDIVKPRSTDDDAFKRIRDALLPPPTVQRLVTRGGRTESAEAKAPVRSPQALVIDRLWNDRATVNTADTVALALALELANRQDDAIALLESRHTGNAELSGVLAGRFKRRWMADADAYPDDGTRAHALYEYGCNLATEAGDHAQAYYNGINHAFMRLALALGASAVPATDAAVQAARAATRDIAMRALAQVRLAEIASPEADHWRLATEGEALLYTGNPTGAIECYTRAVAASPDVRSTNAMLQQAVWTTRLLADDATETALRALFAPHSSS